MIGAFFRLYHIEFGLPHSFHADEPEIAELAIKYTYELRDVVKNNNYYKVIPISYVYGMFPTYLLTLVVMAFSKGANILGIAFDKADLYIAMRSVTAAFSLIIIPAGAAIYYKMFKDKPGSLLTASLLALNWKLIVHSHYVNADTFLAVLITLTVLAGILYFQHEPDNLHTILFGLIYGLAVGTKVTALLSLPMFLYLFIVKKDYRAMFAFLFLILIGFAVTNPFSLIFANDFAFRVYMMKIKEAGLVFDSINKDPFKYIIGLGYIATPGILLTSLYGKVRSIKIPTRENLPLHILLMGTVLIYLLFYSVGIRRVDRWLLPILPIVLVYAAYGTTQLVKVLPTKLYAIGAIALTISYCYFLGLLLLQFQRDTPKSAAYIWLRDNIPASTNKLAVTKEGLDPLNKLQGIMVKRYEVYEREAAQFFMPESPLGYDYVILSSKPMSYHKNEELARKYPFYTEKWQAFETMVLDPANFRLVKKFELPKPNLVELSDVYIYESTATTPIEN